MSSLVIVEQVVVLLVMMGVGVLAGRRGLLDEKLARGLTDVLLRISLPALILLSFSVEAHPGRLRSAMVVVAASLLFHVVMLPLTGLIFRRCPPQRQAVLVFMTHFPNVGFMGMPLVFAIFGGDGIFYASLFMLPFNIVMWTFGQGLFLRDGQKTTWKARLTDPIIMSIMGGLVLLILPWQLPGVVAKPLQSLGATTTPLAMLVIGQLLSLTSPAEFFDDRDILWGMLVRLIGAPLVMAGILRFFSADPVAIETCILLEALPAAISLAVLPARYEGDAAMASRCVVGSHMLSIVTLPVMVVLLGAF